MHAVVGREVELAHRGRCHGPRGVLAHEGEHGAVVVRVLVDVEQVVAGGRAEPCQAARIPALADVDDALEHRRQPRGRTVTVALVRCP